MSVLIKGMEMPESCFHCPLRNNICYEKEKVIRDSMGRRLTVYELEKIFRVLEDCPLVEIPSKHGDLIDRDELLELLVKDNDYATRLCFEGDIKEMPTIIEAEG